MPILLNRAWKLINARLRGWRLPLALVMFVFATSWLWLWLVEPVDNEITRPANYWWWFLVTAATVGYGDFYPSTALGHRVGAYLIIDGIVTLTILFTRMASYLQAVKGKRMKGLVKLDVRDHTVILGYLAGRTEREQLRYVNPKIQCVQWHMPNLITEEALDPGITQVYADLMSSGGVATPIRCSSRKAYGAPHSASARRSSANVTG